MFDITAITAQNGWAQALTGVLIVMSGLTVLSFVISQLHKLIDVLEKSEARKKEARVAASSQKTMTQAVELDKGVLEDLESTARMYLPLTQGFGETFALTNLYQLLQTNKFPHPHLTLRAFREAGYLVPKGDGNFSWAKI